MTNSAGRTLVLPGIPDSEFDWGFTAQIPIQWGSDVTWATRSQAPLSGLDVVEYLDTTELIIERGGSTQLRDYLRRGGFTALVVPNDQTSERYGAPPAETVRNALIASGLELTTSFGERNYGFGDLQQIDIYAIDRGAVIDSYETPRMRLTHGLERRTGDHPQRHPRLLARTDPRRRSRNMVGALPRTS